MDVLIMHISSLPRVIRVGWQDERRIIRSLSDSFGSNASEQRQPSNAASADAVLPPSQMLVEAAIAIKKHARNACQPPKFLRKNQRLAWMDLHGAEGYVTRVLRGTCADTYDFSTESRLHFWKIKTKKKTPLLLPSVQRNQKTMNSRPNSSHTPSSFSNYQFDFGIPSSRSSPGARPLKDQKNPSVNTPNSYSSPMPSYSSPARPTSSASTTPSWSSNKPSWTHQPAPAQQPRSTLPNPTSMAGDIFGKSWTSTTTPPGANLGIPAKNPNLFGDLVGTAFGQGKAASNVPLKDAAPTRNSYSMGNLADSLPKTSAPVKTNNWGSTDTLGGLNSANNDKKSTNSMGKSGGSMASASSSNDPFGSLADFGSKKPQPMAGKSSSLNQNNDSGDYFGPFQNTPSANASNSTSFPSMDGFGMPKTQDKPAAAPQSKGVDPLDSLFSSSASASAFTAAADDRSGGNRPFSEADDWGLDSEYGGNDAGGTTEIEGLPPPPAGLSASTAKSKGLDNHKQGQYADAIKWLSWAVVLLEKSGDGAASAEVLTCRASCYKEVGEYKKAIADCSKLHGGRGGIHICWNDLYVTSAPEGVRTRRPLIREGFKRMTSFRLQHPPPQPPPSPFPFSFIGEFLVEEVLENDSANVSVLLQRALLYESSEKYKLGAEDLRAVLKIEPNNRLAKSTIHRLTKLSD
ncbi:hypothetical protein ACLOJK_026288 [Asimina triloba]